MQYYYYSFSVITIINFGGGLKSLSSLLKYSAEKIVLGDFVIFMRQGRYNVGICYD